MLALIKPKRHEKWHVCTSEKAARGIDAEFVVWVEGPNSEQEFESVGLCGGTQLWLNQLCSYARLSTKAAQVFLDGMEGLPMKEKEELQRFICSTPYQGAVRAALEQEKVKTPEKTTSA